MLLQSLSLRNFRCFAELTHVPLYRLTVFIGENDAGKTALLEALALLCTDQRPTDDKYHLASTGERADTITVSGMFVLESYDTVPANWRSGNGTTLELSKVFCANQGLKSCEVVGVGFTDGRFDSFKDQPADIQKELLERLGIVPGKNKEARIEQFREAQSKGQIPEEMKALQLSFQEVRKHLPLIEIIASTSYKQPDSLVQQTMQNVVAATLRPINPQSQQPELLTELTGVKKKIHRALNRKVKEMTATIRKQLPQLKDVNVSEPDIDFARSVAPGNLMLDFGQGPQPVNVFGEGTKRKLWMALLDWQRSVQMQYERMPVIRLYDEPDVNLDYSAERKLFGNILDATAKSESRTQVFVATHSVTMIDRAPAQSINLIRVAQAGKRDIECLCGSDDAEVRQFLTTVGRAVGIPNSALFYERAFIVVEGESEENALPILYRHLYGHSMIEDGLVLIPLFTSGAWKSVLSILQRHKSDTTFMLLDQDCMAPSSSALVTEAVLTEIGYSGDWRASHCRFIGTKEFEDAFMSKDIVAVLNAHWPREDGRKWTKTDIDQFRTDRCKFSEDIKSHVQRHCIKLRRNSVRKPELAEKLAQHCRNGKQIPVEIREIFRLARIVSGCD